MVNILEDKQIISIVLVIVIEHTDLDDNIWFDTIWPICYSFFWGLPHQVWFTGEGLAGELASAVTRKFLCLLWWKRAELKGKVLYLPADLCPDPNPWTCRMFGLCLRHGEKIPEEPGEVAGTSRSLLSAYLGRFWWVRTTGRRIQGTSRTHWREHGSLRKRWTMQPWVEKFSAKAPALMTLL